MNRTTLVVLSLALAAQAAAATRSLKPADLIKAAKAASASDIDERKKSCDDDRNVEKWLKETVGSSARSIKWSAGRCKLTNKHNPIDAGTDWCARAEIAPRKCGPPATIEVYFDKPKNGQPGQAFAFHASVRTKEGWDTTREISAFEVNWAQTYIPDYKQPENGDCN